MNSNMETDLHSKSWKDFVFEDIFNIDSSLSEIDKNKLSNLHGYIPYITRTEKNNGYDTFTGEQNSQYKWNGSNVITIGLDTQTVFYQPIKFYTGQNIQILKNKHLNREVAQFLIPLIKKQLEKFSWGSYGATLTRLRRSKILLPTNSKDEPDYDYMESFVKSTEREKLKLYEFYLEKELNETKDLDEIVPLEEKDWDEFFIEDIAEIESGRDIYEAKRIKGKTPYISATAGNNGVGYFVGNENKTLESGCLSVNRNGSVGYSFYHQYKALFSNDCRKLRLKQHSKYIGIFIAHQITKQRGKYGYGYKMGTARLKRQKVMLPINGEKKPDYLYIENFIKQLIHQRLTHFTKFKNSITSIALT